MNRGLQGDQDEGSGLAAKPAGGHGGTQGADPQGRQCLSKEVGAGGARWLVGEEELGWWRGKRAGGRRGAGAVPK